MAKYVISTAMMNRLPLYLNYLETQRIRGVDSISATTLAKDMGLGEVLVRKELGVISGNGKPRVGYKVKGLIKDFDKFLHADSTTKAVIVGAGKLGRALMGYKGFASFGVEILAAFDSDIDKVDNKKILPINKLKKFVAENDVQIGIITVPKDGAEEAYESLIASKIKGIWNFAPVVLKKNPKVLIKQENLALSLSHLNLMIKDLNQVQKKEVNTKE